MVARARAWFEALSSGRMTSINASAQADGITRSYVGRMIDLAFLAPDLVEMVMRGEQPQSLTPRRLLDACPLPARWEDQRQLLLDW